MTLTIATLPLGFAAGLDSEVGLVSVVVSDFGGALSAVVDSELEPPPPHPAIASSASSASAPTAK
jgi:hypothetical protein